MLIHKTRRAYNSAPATPLLRWFGRRRGICLGAFRSIDKRVILAHPFAIPSECLFEICAIQLLWQPLTTITMLLLYITCKAHYKLTISFSKCCGVESIVLSCSESRNTPLGSTIATRL